MILNHKKKIIKLIGIILIMMLLSACSRSVDDSKKTVEKVWTGSSSTWKVSVKNVEISDGLNTVAGKAV